MLPTFKRNGRLSPEQTITLLQQAQSGDIEARNRLILGNIGLIVLVIRQNCFGNEMPEEFFTEMIVTTISAIRGFKPDHCTPFSTYLGVCLNLRIRTLKRRFLEKRPFVSLDAPLNTISPDSDTGTLYDVIPDDKDQTEQRFFHIRLDLRKLLSGLDKQEIRIVMDYAHAVPLRETAEVFRVSRQYIEQKRQRIFNRIRETKHYNELLDTAAAGEVPDPPPRDESFIVERRNKVVERLRDLVLDGKIGRDDAKVLSQVINKLYKSNHTNNNI